MGKHFIRRGYPEQMVAEAIIKACRTSRTDLLTEQTKTVDNTEKLFAINTYQPGFDALREIIPQNWDFLTKAKNTKPIHNSQVIYGNRRCKNLRDLLVNLPPVGHKMIARLHTSTRSPPKPADIAPESTSVDKFKAPTLVQLFIQNSSGLQK